MVWAPEYVCPGRMLCKILCLGVGLCLLADVALATAPGAWRPPTFSRPSKEIAPPAVLRAEPNRQVRTLGSPPTPVRVEADRNKLGTDSLPSRQQPQESPKPMPALGDTDPHPVSDVLSSPEHSLQRLRGGGSSNALPQVWRLFSERPPITRSFVSLCVALAMFSSAGAVDLRKMQLSERALLDNGEWWRLLANFFYMGDNVKSFFFWLQMKNLYDTVNVLEQTKYRWSPGDLVHLIGGNMLLLLGLKQCVAKDLTFLGSPLVMAFVYSYSREYKDQVMNFLLMLSVRCGMLPVLQALQDFLMTGDIRPNVLGMLSGHTYFHIVEERKRMLLPKPKLRDIWRFLWHGRPITEQTDTH